MSADSAVKSATPAQPNPRVVSAYLDTAIHQVPVDDRKGDFEIGLNLLSRLPPGAEATGLSNSVIGAMYNTIPHPPSSVLGPSSSFRQADGSGNNLLHPSLGQAGSQYARNTPRKWCFAPSSLPDPELVFDVLLRKRDVQANANGNSGLTLALQSLISHSLFQTDPTDWTTNKTSSYLDLSILYGTNQSLQDRVRDKTSGIGLIYPDTFSDERFLFLPPAAGALVVIFARNHNFIAKNLFKLNERGTWADPPPTDAAARTKQDEEIFQTARLVNCAHFLSLVMGDFVGLFSGLSEGNVWNLNASDPIISKDGVEVPRGQGNQCSIELNLLHQFHSAMSDADEQWTENMFQQTFGKPAKNVTFEEFIQGMGPKLGQAAATDPPKRTFGGLKRGQDNKFSDDDLAGILFDATEHSAGAFRARGIPESLKVFGIKSIKQARSWNACSMNEFRQALGLKQFATFEEWNPNPEIATAARQLYGNINNLELYPGLQCESTMPLGPGSRLAGGYTMTRAILSETIATVRGDRFFTTDFSSANLTAWGYQDCQRVPGNGAFGGELPKLLMRHLPRHYPYTSTYGCFPLFTPQKMKESLTSQGIVGRYTFTRPKAASIPKVLNTFTGIKYLCGDPGRFHVVYDMSIIGKGYGFYLAMDDRAKHDADMILATHALFPSKDAVDEFRAWYRQSIQKHIQERSWQYNGRAGTYIDIVNDVMIACAGQWAAECVAGISLKTKENPGGSLTEKDVYDVFMALVSGFLSVGNNESGAIIQSAAVQAVGVAEALITKSMVEISHENSPHQSPIAGVVASIFHHSKQPAYKPYHSFQSKLLESGRPLIELVSNVVGVATGSCANFAQAAVFVIDFYLDDARAKERAHIQQLAKLDDDDSFELMMGYGREAMRLNPQFPGVYRDAVVDARIPQGAGLPDLEVKAGDRIFASFKNAHVNPAEFPDPTSVDPRRPKAIYNVNGTGFHRCLGADLVQYNVAEIMKVVFGLKNLRRAPGKAGKLAGFQSAANGTPINVFIKSNGTITPWAGAMHLVYDS